MAPTPRTIITPATTATTTQKFQANKAVPLPLVMTLEAPVLIEELATEEVEEDAVLAELVKDELVALFRDVELAASELVAETLVRDILGLAELVAVVVEEETASEMMATVLFSELATNTSPFAGS